MSCLTDLNPSYLQCINAGEWGVKRKVVGSLVLSLAKHLGDQGPPNRGQVR